MLVRPDGHVAWRGDSAPHKRALSWIAFAALDLRGALAARLLCLNAVIATLGTSDELVRRVVVPGEETAWVSSFRAVSR